MTGEGDRRGCGICSPGGRDACCTRPPGEGIDHGLCDCCHYRLSRDRFGERSGTGTRRGSGRPGGSVAAVFVDGEGLSAQSRTLTPGQAAYRYVRVSNDGPDVERAAVTMSGTGDWAAHPGLVVTVEGCTRGWNGIRPRIGAPLRRWRGQAVPAGTYPPRRARPSALGSRRPASWAVDRASGGRGDLSDRRGRPDRGLHLDRDGHGDRLKGTVPGTHRPPCQAPTGSKRLTMPAAGV